jgi:CRP-like cAMP-binding protein
MTGEVVFRGETEPID